jgi:endonuclease/exonuclease/phosphatase family metal-dependent hydrolase
MLLLSWNVQWCRGVDGRVDPARIAHEIRRLAAPDVVCLQEVATNFAELPGSAGEDQAHALMRELPGYEGCLVSGVDVPAPGGGRARFGNLILSRLPLGRVLRHSLPWPADSDAQTMPRVAVEAIVQVPFGALRVITTHLEYYSQAHREAQVARLRELHAEACGKRVPVAKAGAYRNNARPASAIVCGDFNMRPDNPLHARMQEAFAGATPPFRDAWEALNPGKPHPHSFKIYEKAEGEVPYCCDFMFMTEDLLPRLRSIRIDGLTQASDHQPVIAEIG